MFFERTVLLVLCEIDKNSHFEISKIFYRSEIIVIDLYYKRVDI